MVFLSALALPNAGESYGRPGLVRLVTSDFSYQSTLFDKGSELSSGSGFTGLLHLVNNKQGTKQQEVIDKKYIVIRDGQGRPLSGNNGEGGTITTAIDNRNDENSLNAFYQATTVTEKPENSKRLQLRVRIKESGQVLQAKERSGVSPAASVETGSAKGASRAGAADADQAGLTANYAEPALERAYDNTQDLSSSSAQGSAEAIVNSGAGYLNDGFHGSLAPGYDPANGQAGRQGFGADETTIVNPENKYYKKFKKYDRDSNEIVSLREFSVYQLTTFNRLDKDGDNEVSYRELLHAFKKSRQKGLKLLKRLDKNRNRIIERNEFRFEVIRRFRRYDDNKNGIIEIGSG